MQHGRVDRQNIGGERIKERKRDGGKLDTKFERKDSSNESREDEFNESPIE